MKNKKPIIGIMGGIGSGKSTVAAEFAKLNCKVIDADKIVHDLLEEKDIQELATDMNIPIVICPRSNHALGVSDSDKYPPVKREHQTGKH